MKPSHHPIYTFRGSHFLMLGCLFCFTCLTAQKENLLLPDLFYPGMVQDNNLEIITEDSCVVINLIESYIRPQLRKQYLQDINTTRKYIYQAMGIAQRINYMQGIHVLRRCLGSAYTAKGPQDSAQFYLRYSIKQMEDKQDTARIIFFLMQCARSCSLSSKFNSSIYVDKTAALNTLTTG